MKKQRNWYYVVESGRIMETNENQ